MFPCIPLPGVTCPKVLESVSAPFRVAADTDQDGVVDPDDNCPTVSNPDQADRTQQDRDGETTEQLLSRILEQLKRIQRAEMFGEFSIMRLIAGVVQIIVLCCLLISIWFLMDPNRQNNSVLIALGFAMVLQMMSLTFYIMQGRK